MSDFKYDRIPSFTRRDGNAILYNGDGEVQYYIPERYFEGRSATIEGTYIRLLGSFLYRIFSKTGVPGELKKFEYPTVFLCRPSYTEKKKDIQLDANSSPDDYRVLGFVNGDQLVTNVFTPQFVDNTGDLLSLHIITGKIPNLIPYDELYNYPYQSMELNGSKFDIHSQLMGLMYSKVCRDPDDISKLFRTSKAIDKDMKSYKTMSIKDVPKYTSPYAAITSENIDEGILASVLISEDIKEGKTTHTYSPLEQVLTM